MPKVGNEPILRVALLRLEVREQKETDVSKI